MVRRRLYPTPSTYSTVRSLLSRLVASGHPLTIPRDTMEWTPSSGAILRRSTSATRLSTRLPSWDNLGRAPRFTARLTRQPTSRLDAARRSPPALTTTRRAPATFPPKRPRPRSCAQPGRGSASAGSSTAVRFHHASCCNRCVCSIRERAIPTTRPTRPRRPTATTTPSTPRHSVAAPTMTSRAHKGTRTGAPTRTSSLATGRISAPTTATGGTCTPTSYLRRCSSTSHTSTTPHCAAKRGMPQGTPQHRTRRSPSRPWRPATAVNQ
mmetsp:Transcript_69962/g.116193  ORF Transcript_69962/g.116193 Transcript_69962/m.116193 type:complete len:267 (+) Transcript_69962:491-1291(+)